MSVEEPLIAYLQRKLRYKKDIELYNLLIREVQDHRFFLCKIRDTNQTRPRKITTSFLSVSRIFRFQQHIRENCVPAQSTTLTMEDTHGRFCRPLIDLKGTIRRNKCEIQLTESLKFVSGQSLYTHTREFSAFSDRINW